MVRRRPLGPRTLLVALMGVTILAGWVFLIERHLFRRPEIRLCREFVKGRPEVNAIVGEIESVHLEKRGSSLKGFGRQFSGRYYFAIVGDKGRGTFYTDWESMDGTFRVIAVGCRKGLTERELWVATRE